MTPTELNEGFELEKKATKGPWTDPYGSMWEDNPGKVHSAGIFFGKTGMMINLYSPYDAALIRFLRNHALELLEAARKVEEMEKGVTVSFDARDEAYCDWYECSGCKNTMITKTSKFCPNCGKKIIR